MNSFYFLTKAMKWGVEGAYHFYSNDAGVPYLGGIHKENSSSGYNLQMFVFPLGVSPPCQEEHWLTRSCIDS